MASETKPGFARRTPQIPRGELRVAVLLDAAAAVIEEVGYEAATMTAVAHRAGSSIGAAYQYYSDKAEIAEALCNKFGEELAQELEHFAASASALDVRKMVAQVVAIVMKYTNKHPALLLVMHVRSRQQTASAFRRRLRLCLAELFQSKAENLSGEEAYRMASTVLQVVKSLHPLMAEVDISEQQGSK